MSSCPQSSYETLDGVCEACPLPCDECFVDRNNQSSVITCISCVVGRYLVTVDNVTECTGLCPDQHYAGTQKRLLRQQQLVVVVVVVVFELAPRDTNDRASSNSVRLSYQ